jgi:hypothetical protein
MGALRSRQRERQLRELLARDHTLNGGILFGLDGYVIEVQARAMEVLKGPAPWPAVTDVSGMAGVAVREATASLDPDFILIGDVGSRGALSMAYIAKARESLIVAASDEKKQASAIGPVPLFPCVSSSGPRTDLLRIEPLFPARAAKTALPTVASCELLPVECSATA